MGDPLTTSIGAKHYPQNGVPGHNPVAVPRQDELFQLEEVTHFTRPTNLLPSNPFSSSYHNERAPQPISTSFPIMGHQQRPGQVQIDYSQPDNSDDESETEFDKRFRKLKPNQPPQPSTSSMPSGSSSFHFFEREPVSADNDSDPEDYTYDRYETPKKIISKATPANGGGQNPVTNTNFRHSGDSFNLPSLSGVRVVAGDVGSSAVVFLVHLVNFLVDIALVVWYYRAGWSWSSTLTCASLLVGGIGILHQFSMADKDRLNRLFKHGRRVRILINCFPPLGTVMCSWYCLRAAWTARRDQMFSVRFFALEEFSQSLTRVQGFFQSAPQATVQLVILMENVDGVILEGGLLIVASIVFSLVIMTLANLPGREEVIEDSIRRGVHVPVTPSSRLFLGVRMLSSFGSRTMAIGYFFMGLRCLLGSALTFPSIMCGIIAILIPRLLFASIDYAYHLLRVRRGRQPASGGRLSCCGTFTGYLATVCYPMGEPKWIFWFIWVETGVFMLWGNIAAWSVTPTCLTNTPNAIYTGVFCLTFLVIPIFLPYARASLKQHRIKKLERFFEQKSQEDSQSSSGTTMQSTDSV